MMVDKLKDNIIGLAVSAFLLGVVTGLGIANYAHVRITGEVWKRINREREPNETLSDTLKKLLDDRDRLRHLIKVNVDAP